MFVYMPATRGFCGVGILTETVLNTDRHEHAPDDTTVDYPANLSRSPQPATQYMATKSLISEKVFERFDLLFDMVLVRLRANTNFCISAIFCTILFPQP